MPLGRLYRFSSYNIQEQSFQLSWFVKYRMTITIYLANKAEFSLNDSSQKWFHRMLQSERRYGISMQKMQIGSLIIQYVCCVTFVPLNHYCISYFTSINVSWALPYERSCHFTLMIRRKQRKLLSLRIQLGLTFFSITIGFFFEDDLEESKGLNGVFSSDWRTATLAAMLIELKWKSKLG